MKRFGDIAVLAAVVAGLASCGVASSASQQVKTVQVGSSCRDITVTNLMKVYRSMNYTLAMANIVKIGNPRRFADPSGDMVYSSVTLADVTVISGPTAQTPSDALVLGGDVDGLDVQADSPSGLVSGQRAVLALWNVEGIGMTVVDAYLVDGQYAILDGVCQKPGSLPTSPVAANVRGELASGLGDSTSTPVAVALPTFLSIVKG